MASRGIINQNWHKILKLSRKKIIIFCIIACSIAFSAGFVFGYIKGVDDIMRYAIEIIKNKDAWDSLIQFLEEFKE